MQITVHYTTQLKATLGVAQECIELPSPATIRQLLLSLDQRHAGHFRRLALTPQGALLPSILMCVNDCQVDPGSSNPLPEGAVVTLLSAISGG